MLHARSDAGEQQTCTERGETARQAQHQVARGYDQRRSDQRAPAAKSTCQAVSGHLEAAHGALVETAQHRQSCVVQAELSLPDWKQHVDQLRGAVMHQMGNARLQQSAPLTRP